MPNQLAQARVDQTQSRAEETEVGMPWRRVVYQLVAGNESRDGGKEGEKAAKPTKEAWTQDEAKAVKLMLQTGVKQSLNRLN